MGNYATTTMISVRLPGFLVSDTTTSDTTATNTFASYIEKAEAEFNAHMAKRYSLPFTTVPPLARDLSFEMAAWYTIRAFSSRDWPNRNDVLDDFKTSFEKTMLLSQGKLRLTLTDGSLLSSLNTLIQSNREGQGSVFEVDEPRAWKAVQNRLDELEGSRD